MNRREQEHNKLSIAAPFFFLVNINFFDLVLIYFLVLNIHCCGKIGEENLFLIL